MIRSMTGYGRGRSERDEMAFVVEIRSVNHRYGDVTVKAPRMLLGYENDIRKRVGLDLKRGKIDVFISQDQQAMAGAMPVVNRPLAKAYVDLFQQIKKEYHLGGEVPLSLLVGQRDVVMVQEADPDDDRLKLVLDAALDDALAGIIAMRDREGVAMEQDIRQRLAATQVVLDAIAERATQVVGAWRQKLSERLARSAADIQVDPQRLAQEVAIFAERCDITEEITRFRSHVDQFMHLLNDDQDEPVGRKLDFLVQELNRETNTIGSKANDADLARQVVDIKAELEKIREQVQNIE